MSAQPYEAGRERIDRLWTRLSKVTDDAEVATVLKGRGLDPARITALDLARALPHDMSVPNALRVGQRSWTDLYLRLILPTYGPSGALVAVRGRRIRTDPSSGHAKELAPRLGAGSAKGHLFANPPARKLLELGTYNPLAGPVVVVEGSPDFLTWATRRPDLPVLGLWSGAWTPQLAARIPSGTTVVIRTHHDEKGDEYARVVHRSLHPRCPVYRSTPGRSHLIAEDLQ